MVSHLIRVDLGTILEELIQDRLLLVVLDTHTFALNGTVELMFTLLSLIVVARGVSRLHTL